MRLRWSGNSSRKYDGRVEDVPIRCVLLEDLPLAVGKSVRARLDSGAGERVWSGTVVETRSVPSALELALPEKRATANKEDPPEQVHLATRMYICMYKQRPTHV